MKVWAHQTTGFNNQFLQKEDSPMNTEKVLRITRVILAISFLMIFASCSRWGHHTGHHHTGAGGEELAHDASGTVTSAGGTVEVTEPGDPILGVKVVLPPGALDSDEQATINIDYEDNLPGTLDTGVVGGSKCILLTKDTNYKFKLPVTVTMPYDDSNMGSDDIPFVFYWDEGSGKYIPVGVKDIDTENKLLTFTTVHFGKFVVLTLKGFDPAQNLVDTGFRPDVDGFFHPNFGTYDAPGGNSAGMACYAAWYYSTMKATDGTGLFGSYLEGNPSVWGDDVTARELISRANMDASNIWASMWPEADYQLSGAATGKLLAMLMNMTKAPQTLVLGGDNFSQAVTVYYYDNVTGTFWVYDSNFPGEQIFLRWDATNGFYNYSKAAAYPEIKKYSLEGVSTFFAAKELEALYSGAKTGWDKTSKFETITVTAPALDENDTAVVSDPNNVTITGTVTGGNVAAKYLVYNVNGTDGLGGTIVALGAGGSFSFTIPNLPKGTNYIWMVASDDRRDATRRVPNGYCGFKAITIKVHGQEFFTNIGFEMGDFTGWSVETHTWSNTTPGSITPVECAIETQGSDPIDAAIQKVVSGQYSARINDWYWGAHISTLTQSAVVPNVNNPELRFSWAAILEDPQHDPSEQPYVDIVITDDTAGTTLFTKHFYTNDPNYSGWEVISGSGYGDGEWKCIPWQTVIVDCCSAKGHQITLKITGADCEPTGHGGYVYVDSQE